MSIDVKTGKSLTWEQVALNDYKMRAVDSNSSVLRLYKQLIHHTQESLRFNANPIWLIKNDVYVTMGSRSMFEKWLLCMNERPWDEKYAAFHRIAKRISRREQSTQIQLHDFSSEHTQKGIIEQLHSTIGDGVPFRKPRYHVPGSIRVNRTEGVLLNLSPGGALIRIDKPAASRQYTDAKMHWRELGGCQWRYIGKITPIAFRGNLIHIKFDREYFYERLSICNAHTQIKTTRLPEPPCAIDAPKCEIAFRDPLANSFQLLVTEHAAHWHSKTIQVPISNDMQKALDAIQVESPKLHRLVHDWLSRPMVCYTSSNQNE